MNPRHKTCRRHGRLDPPHSLRPGLLVVFDGARWSGKTTQLSRFRVSQRSAGLFVGDPLFVELPRDLRSTEATEKRAAARAALAAGRPVFAERWHPHDQEPDVTFVSLSSHLDRDYDLPRPQLMGRGVVIAEPGYESLVSLQLLSVLRRRGLMAPCPCGLAA